MAEAMPRFVAGYSRLDRLAIEWESILELRSDLERTLSEIVAPIPGAGPERTRAAFDYGFGVRLDALAQFVQARAAAIRQAPYECQWLEGLNRFSGRSGEIVAPLYAASTWLTGARLVVTDLAWEGDLPERLEAALVLVSPNPPALLGMIKSIVPALAGLDLDPSAPPMQVSLDGFKLDHIADDLPSLYAVMREGVVGVAAGEESRRALLDYMSAPAREPAPLFYRGQRPPVAEALIVQFLTRIMGWETSMTGTQDAIVHEMENRVVNPSESARQFWAEGSELEMLGWLLLESAGWVEFELGYVWDATFLSERGIETRQSVRLR